MVQKQDGGCRYSCLPPEYGARVNRAHARREQFSAVACAHRHIAVWDLARAALVTKLTHRFGEARQVSEVIAAQEPAACINRDCSAGSNRAAFHERPAFPFLTPAIVFELKQNLAGEAIIELRALHIF